MPPFLLVVRALTRSALQIASYLFNQVLVDALANNRAFQRFAIRSNEAFQDLAKKGAQLICTLVSMAAVAQHTHPLLACRH